MKFSVDRSVEILSNELAAVQAAPIAFDALNSIQRSKETSLEGRVPIMKDEIAAMDKSVMCLALELPGSVWDDVNKKWQELKAQLLVSKMLQKCDHCGRDGIPNYETVHLCSSCASKYQESLPPTA